LFLNLVFDTLPSQTQNREPADRPGTTHRGPAPADAFPFFSRLVMRKVGADRLIESAAV
jgi:hypothetical protein